MCVNIITDSIDVSVNVLINTFTLMYIHFYYIKIKLILLKFTYTSCLINFIYNIFKTKEFINFFIFKNLGHSYLK